MSSVQYYGPPPDAAGIAVEYRFGNPPPTFSPMGSCVILGDFPKGLVNQYMETRSQSMARRRSGGLDKKTQCPLAREDFFWAAGDISAPVYLVRITDGNEAKAFLYLYARDCSRNHMTREEILSMPSEVAKIEAGTPGTWGGQFYRFGDKVASVSGAISGSVWDTALTGSSWPFKPDQLEGGTLYLQGETRSWEITANGGNGTDDGKITVKGDFSDVTTTDGRWWIVLDNVDSDGDPKYAGVIVEDGGQDPEDNFSLRYRENKNARDLLWSDCHLDSDNKRYFETFVNDDASQYELIVDDTFSGDVEADKSKPANFAEIAVPSGVTANTVKFRVAWYDNKAGNTGDGYIDYSTFTFGANVIPHRVVLTLTGAAAYTVAIWDFEGNVRLDGGNLANGTVGAAYAAPFNWASGHTLTAGSTPFAASDVVTIYVRPLPANLKDKEGYFFPYAWNWSGSLDVRTKYRIYSNTYDTITLGPNDNVSAIVTPPVAATETGATAEPAGPAYYAWAGTETFKFKKSINGVLGSEVTLTTSLGAGPQTAADIASDFNTQDAGANILFAATTVGANTYVKWTARHLYGGSVGIQVTAGTANAVLGFSDNTLHVGTDGTVGRCQYISEMVMGRDGNKELDNADYLVAADPNTSPLLPLIKKDTGRCVLITPDVENASVINAFGSLCLEKLNFQHIPNISSAITTDEGAATWWQGNIVPNRMMGPRFPSYGYSLVHPYEGSGNYLQTLVGLIAGIESKYAVKYNGYHKAPADEEARIDLKIKHLVSDQSDGTPIELNNALLNQNGIMEVRHDGPAIFLFGDEVLDSTKARVFWHKVNCWSHIGRELGARSNYLCFWVMDKKYYLALASHIRQLLKPKSHWFIGDSFEDKVAINVSEDVNVPELSDKGESVAAIGFKIVNTNKKLTYVISPDGIGSVF